jgi:tellurite methyltransferase
MTKDRWAQYYTANNGRPPRKLLVEALGYTNTVGSALDMGAGDLTDSLFLVSKGYNVTALDNSPSSKQIFEQLDSKSFIYIDKKFDEFEYQPNKYDLITAQFALPFNRPETFDTMFNSLKNSLKHKGFFVGHFFGVNDEWNVPNASMTFHSSLQVERLLSTMTILKLSEEEKDGKTATGTQKHWHIFHVIAQKK